MTCEMDPEFLEALNAEFGKRLSENKIKVGNVKLKIGNEIHTIELTYSPIYTMV
jgi:hypothetical protein